MQENVARTTDTTTIDPWPSGDLEPLNDGVRQTNTDLALVDRQLRLLRAKLAREELDEAARPTRAPRAGTPYRYLYGVHKIRADVAHFEAQRTEIVARQRQLLNAMGVACRDRDDAKRSAATHAMRATRRPMLRARVQLARVSRPRVVRSAAASKPSSTADPDPESRRTVVRVIPKGGAL